MNPYLTELADIKAKLSRPDVGLDEIQRHERRVAEIDGILSRGDAARTSAKAAAILAGVGGSGAPDFADNYDGAPFLAQVKAARFGDPDANAYVKGVLGTSDATGLAIVPGNFLAGVAAQAASVAPWRSILNVVTGTTGAAVDIPYEATAVTRAMLQGAFGSNKDVRDFSFGLATATLYTIAQIADIGNQFLRQSNGAAERIARRRLGTSIGLAESNFIVNGTGSSQPRGFLQALLDFGDVALYKTTLSSEPRLATIGRAIGALEARGQRAGAIVLHPTTFWATATEGLGTTYAGGWALDPAAGPAGRAPQQTAWGIPVFRCADLPTATGLVIDSAQMDMYFGQSLTIQVSSEGGNRFDQNVTGFRAEEEFAFDALPYVATGMVQKVLGL